MKRILVVDPGKMTGWGFLESWSSDGSLCTSFYGGELPHDAFIDWAFQQLSSQSPDLNPIDAVVCEGFTINARTQQQAPTDKEMWSVKQIGILETFCRWYGGVPFIRQMPADKNFDKNGDKLKRLGWWAASPGVTGEAGHRRDAARHALKYAVDHNLIDLRRLLP